jgi:RNA polymerase sigma factor (TIGR02999 family)
MDLDAQIAEHYESLKVLAHRMLRQSREGTLRTTGLVHEVFLKLRAIRSTESEAHLMNLAARVMRQVLVDAARRRQNEKRGGDWQRVSLKPGLEIAGDDQAHDVLAIEQSLRALELQSPTLAQVVELHFFGGLSFPEMSRVLGINERTLFRYWRTARAQIQADLGAVAPPE